MKYYLTTPIYYVNAAPHIGHTYTTLAAETIKRFKRMQGYDVVLTTGTDEHGQKVERSAQATGKSPEEFTTIVSNEFRALWDRIGIQYDHFIRTTNPDGMAKWFEDKLGAEVVRTMQQGKPRIDLKLGGANIFIAPVETGDGVNAAPTTPYRGLDHFGLSVSGIDAIAADLKAKGVEFTREPTTVRPGTRVCFIRGPEGVSIELLDRNV